MRGPLPSAPHLPPIWLRPGPGSASPTGGTCGSRLLASAQRPAAFPEPLASHPTVAALCPRRARPAQAPGPTGYPAGLDPSSCPHHPAQSPTFGPQIRAPALLPAPEQSCPASRGTINPVKAAAGHTGHQWRWPRAWWEALEVHPHELWRLPTRRLSVGCTEVPGHKLGSLGAHTQGKRETGA